MNFEKEFGIRRITSFKTVIASEMKRLEVTPQGVSIMLGKTGAIVYKLCGISWQAALIIKQEMLSAGGDAAIPKRIYYKKPAGGRYDILVFGLENQLVKFADKLLSQEVYSLNGIGEALKNLLTGNTGLTDNPFAKGRTAVMGILNVTPDSFYDGGRYFDAGSAAERAFQIEEEGADLIDIGGASSRPGSRAVPEKTEFSRVLGVLKKISGRIRIPISVDTYRLRVGRCACDHGAAVINDITGFKSSPGLLDLVIKNKMYGVIMHMRGTPGTMQKKTAYKSIVDEVYGFLQARIDETVKKGMEKNRIIADPGIGFGKSPAGSIELLSRFSEFRSLGVRLLAGASRKSFIGEVLGLPPEGRLEGSLAALAAAIQGGADIVRVHDVKESVRFCRMLETLLPGKQNPLITGGEVI